MALLLHLVASLLLAFVLRSLAPGRAPAGALMFLLSPAGLVGASGGVPQRSILGAALALASLGLWLADREAPAGGSAAYYGMGGVLTGLLVTVGPLAGPLAYLGAIVLDPAALPLPLVMALLPPAPGRRPAAVPGLRARLGRVLLRLAGHAAALVTWGILVAMGTVARPEPCCGSLTVLGTALCGPLVDPASTTARAVAVGVAVAVAAGLVAGRGRRDASACAGATALFCLAAGALDGTTYLAAAMLWGMLGALLPRRRKGPGR